MSEGIILGLIQGVTEWLPISSEGIIALISIKFFDKSLIDSVSMAAFLHLGTFFAVIVYFKGELIELLKGGGTILRFLITSTVVTSFIGMPLFFVGIEFLNESSTGIILAVIGILLVVTGIAQFQKDEENFRTEEELGEVDAVIAGGLQGLSVLPGLSRSALTSAALLFRKVNDSAVLKISFLMSLPVVLGANIVVNLSGNGIEMNSISLVALASSFFFGLITIDLLLRIAQKVNFGWFAIGFGLLTLFSLFFI